MNKCLRPQVFDGDASSPEGARKWLHRRQTFQSYIGRIDNVTDADKLDMLIKCNQKGHFAIVCRSTRQSSRAVASVTKDNFDDRNLAALSATSHSQDDKLNVYIMLNGVLANALIDTDAKHNHIDSKFCQTAGSKAK